MSAVSPTESSLPADSDPTKVPFKEVFIGGDYGKRSGCRPVAASHCRLELPSGEEIEACESAFRELGAILQRRDDDEILYEWANVRRAELQVTLKVLWYDLDYFHARKNAYLFGPHAFALQRFGLTPADLVVDHELLGRASNSS